MRGFILSQSDSARKNNKPQEEVEVEDLMNKYKVVRPMTEDELTSLLDGLGDTFTEAFKAVKEMPETAVELEFDDVLYLLHSLKDLDGVVHNYLMEYIDTYREAATELGVQKVQQRYYTRMEEVQESVVSFLHPNREDIKDVMETLEKAFKEPEGNMRRLKNLTDSVQEGVGSMPPELEELKDALDAVEESLPALKALLTECAERNQAIHEYLMKTSASYRRDSASKVPSESSDDE